MQIIDLSIAIEDGLPCDPPPQIPHIRYMDHKSMAAEMASFYKGATVDDLPGGNGWAVDFVDACTHAGTHIDAPYHYYPTMNGGERAWTIDEVPLEWCIGDGVKVDFRHFPDGYKATAKDFEDFFVKIGYTLRQGDIVFVNTGASANWGKPEYLSSGCGISAEATLWLIDNGVHVTGTDAWSWDIPLSYTSAEFESTGDAGVIWESHRVGIEKAYCHIEKLTNLELLPAFGFKVSCLPIKIKNASAGWCRAVAFID